MVEEPGRYLEDFARAGADLLVIHQEASTHPQRDLQKIHDLGLLGGLSLNPGTGLETVRWLAADMNLLLLMSVNPGFPARNLFRNLLKKSARPGTYWMKTVSSTWPSRRMAGSIPKTRQCWQWPGRMCLFPDPLFLLKRNMEWRIAPLLKPARKSRKNHALRCQ